MLAQMGNVLEDQTLVIQREMIEKYQMLVDLAHVANMWHHPEAEFLGQDGHSQVFTDSRQTGTVSLHDSHRGGLKKILPNHAVVDRFPNGNKHRTNRLCDFFVRKHIIRLSRFLDPKGTEFGES